MYYKDLESDPMDVSVVSGVAGLCDLKRVYSQLLFQLRLGLTRVRGVRRSFQSRGDLTVTRICSFAGGILGR